MVSRRRHRLDLARSLPPPPTLQLRDAIIFCVAPIAGIAYYCENL